MLSNWLKSPWLGGCGFAIAIVWAMFEFLGAPYGAPLSKRDLVAALAVAIVAAAQAFGAMIAKFRNLEAMLEPKFEILFSPSSQPFLVDKTYIRSPAPGAVATRMRIRKYRVGIVNRSRMVIPGVHAVLERCVPPGADQPAQIGMRFQVMDSDPAVGERDLHPPVKDEPTLFFDIVRELGSEDDGIPQELGFCYASSSLLRRTRPDHFSEDTASRYSFNVTIRVSGGGYSTSQEFRIRKDWDESSHRYRAVTMEQRKADWSSVDS